MKMLVVCSGNADRIAPFVQEQVDELRKIGVEVEFFLIRGRGVSGYLKNRRPLIQHLNDGEYRLIHAHYGLSGLLATLQKSVPVVITYHGSDVRFPRENILSSLASLNASWRIFVSEQLKERIYLEPEDRYSIIPCGVDLDTFYPIDMTLAREELGMSMDTHFVLFSSAFNREVKNYPLAKSAVDLIDNVKLVEFKGYTRPEVNLLMNACNVALLTSHYEGAATQFLKEAMACNRPIVTVGVSDVPRLVSGVDGCFICDYDPEDVADKLRLALNFRHTETGRQKVSQEAGDVVAYKLLEVYRQVLATDVENSKPDSIAQ